MARTNYAFEKRQRELEKARKKQEKAQRKNAPPPASQPLEQSPEQPAKPDTPPHE
jgi:hypothetical protein